MYRAPVNKFLSTVILVFFTANTLSEAHQPQEGRVLATGGFFTHQTHALKTFDNADAPLLLGVGLLAEGDLNDYGGLEVGLFYYDKSYLRNSGTGLVVEKTHKLDVPIGYRYWFNPVFSAGLSLSALFSVGDYQFITNANTSGDVTGAETLTEYAVDLSFQWEVWSSNLVGIILDGRYAYSLSGKAGEDANQYGLFVGFKYFIQEK